MSSTTFANTDEGAAALRRAIIDHINSDPKLIESSREQRRRNTRVIIYAARLLLTADAEHGVHLWFSPEVLRALKRPRSNDALANQGLVHEGKLLSQAVNEFLCSFFLLDHPHKGAELILESSRWA